jgi:enoyl-CoA hydratase/carnithine racemase
MPGGRVSFDVEGSVARLIIDNPPLNILTNDVRQGMLAAINSVEQQPKVKVIVFSGAGDRAFSVGSDIREFPEDEAGGVAKIRFEQHLYNRLGQLPQVTIARLHGHVLGGGAELMLACDLRIADDTVQIGFPEIRLGALPAAGGMNRLVHAIGPARAREMILTGEPISAAEARDCGLVNKIVAPAELDEAVSSIAAQLAKAPSDALRLAKRCIDAVSRDPRVDTLEAEAFAELYRGKNLREGLAAFLAKREPEFDRH